MVFRRRPRPNWYFQARTETGRKSLGTGTSSKQLAGKVEAMWETLAVEHRAWDILNRVLGGTLAIGTLYDRWQDAKQNIAALRRHLEDVDVMAHLPEFLEKQARHVKADSLAHTKAHIEAILPATLHRSRITTDLLTAALHGYPGRRNTIRKAHSSLSVFFAYLTDVKGLFEANPMDRVERPEVEKSPIMFYDMAAVERIVGWQPTPERRVLMAVQYGTAMDLSTTLTLTRADVWDMRREIRAAGTKWHTRDRVVRVADWAWPILEEYVADLLPTARLFPASWNRWTVSDWHRETVKALELPVYPLRNARHHWAVRALRAGAPLSVVQHQLGHGSPQLTLTVYGRFAPDAADRDRWERAASETDPRSAKDGAKMHTKLVSNSRGGT